MRAHVASSPRAVKAGFCLWSAGTYRELLEPLTPAIDAHCAALYHGIFPIGADLAMLQKRPLDIPRPVTLDIDKT